MALRFIDISYAYGANEAISHIGFDAAPGQITCLVGPSGCGKTTLLRLAAGLLEMQSGAIELDGETIADAKQSPPPEDRRVGLVFQEGALFPHLTVAENIAFGLRASGEAAAIVTEILSQLRLEAFADRYPHTLSGGQQQRVSLGRAIAPAPRVLLLDEPFANVDVVLRRRLREETRQILRAQGAVAILVTHDPEEALELADRIAVMENGRLIQIGPPAEVFDRPASPFVGCLFGDGQILRGTRRGDRVETAFGDWPLEDLKQTPATASAIDLLVRPNALSLIPLDDADTAGARVDDIRVLGPSQRIRIIAADGSRLWIDAPRESELAIGRHVRATPQPQAVIAFERES